MACVVAAASFGTGAFGQVLWMEDFDAYTAGTGLFGQGGWTAWDDDIMWDSLVSDAHSNSPANSVDIVRNSDTVYRFDQNLGTIDCGQWTLTAMQFVPMNLAGESYFILLNEYINGGPNNWSTQVHFDSVTQTVIADFSGETLPLVTGQWVPIQVDIDLQADTQTFSYNGQVLYAGTWTEQVSGGGQLQLQAMDLFANAASSVFYDDFQLEKTGDGGCVAPDCLTVSVDRLIGGLASTFTIDDPNGSNAVVALVYGFQDGQTNVNGQSGYCASFGIKGVNQNKLICQGKLSAGQKTCRQPIPGSAVGKRVLFQAAMRDTCPDTCMSNLLDMVVQ